MKKYSSFFRMRFLNGLQYRGAALAGIVTQFAWGIMAILMFQAFYRTNSEAFPMTFQALVSYIWMQQAFLALFAVWVMENEIFELIQSGNVAYELCRPVRLYHMWFARGLAYKLSRAVLRCMPMLLLAALLPVPYRIGPPQSLWAFGWFLITMIVSLLLSVALCMIIYIITFYTISPMGVRMVFVNLVEFFSGGVIPLPFLPEGVRKAVEFLPFASLQNVPFRIYSGDIGGQQILLTFGRQLMWLVLFLAFGNHLMKKALRRAVIQGG